jgi:hypothetical protein
MTHWLTWILAAVGGAVAAHFWYATTFQASIASDVALLETLSGEVPSPRNDLPEEIAAFARRGLGAAPRSFVRLRQQGSMRLDPNKDWSPMLAQHVASTYQSSFVWRATVRMAAMMTVVVVDSYVAGEGRLEARLFGSIRVARAAGADTDKAELMRYLAELPWTPEAILYNRTIRWRQLGDREYEASADSSGGEARVRVLLDPVGDITQVFADDRPRTVPGGSVPTPWRGLFSSYGEVGGYRTPRVGEVSWMLPEGEFTYWRGTVVEVDGD